MRKPCFNCEKTQPVKIIYILEKIIIKEKEISFIAEYTQCRICKEYWEGKGQLDKNLKSIRNLY